MHRTLHACAHSQRHRQTYLSLCHCLKLGSKYVAVQDVLPDPVIHYNACGSVGMIESTCIKLYRLTASTTTSCVLLA